MISGLVSASLHGVGLGWCMPLNIVLVSLSIPFSVTIGLVSLTLSESPRLPKLVR